MKLISWQKFTMNFKSELGKLMEVSNNGSRQIITRPYLAGKKPKLQRKVLVKLRNLGPREMMKVIIKLTINGLLNLFIFHLLRYMSYFNFILGSNFIFLFQTHYHTLKYPKTKENKI